MQQTKPGKASVLLLSISLTFVWPILADANTATCASLLSGASKTPGQAGPVGSLTFQNDALGSTGPKWFRDANGKAWLIKSDVYFDELQTAAEIISSTIYRKLGVSTPQIYLTNLKGKRAVAIESLGSNLIPDRFLNEINSTEFRQVRIFAAFLKDWDRLRSHHNFDLGNQKFAIADFGGTLGSRAHGKHKPGHVFSDAIGTFEADLSGAEIYRGFDVSWLYATHAWRKLVREDAALAAQKLSSLSDNFIRQTVQGAGYSNKSDSEYMIRALKSRRDALIDYLENHFEPDIKEALTPVATAQIAPIEKSKPSSPGAKERTARFI